MAYNPKSKRTNPKGTPQQIKSLNGLTANKNIDDIRALSKISNSHDNSIDTLNSDVKIINGEISSLQKTKQDNIKLTTIGTSGPATLSGSKLNIPDYSGGLGGFVPYIGATQNVDLGEFELKAGQIEFDQTPTGTPGVAIMRWNDQDGTVDLGLKGGNVTLQIGQEQVTRVVNKTGVNLLEANYQAVRISGAQGNRLKVDLAQANNDANSAETLGIVTETINNNQEGFITTSGLVRNINTTGSIQGETWADGDMLYLSGTVAGQLTNIKPTAPIHTVIMGYVVRAHSTQGQIYVKVDNGYELDELHNVAISSPINNQGLFYETATQLWKNKSISTALGYTPVPDSRTLSINGTTYDLTANRSWSVGTVTSVTASAPLSSSGGTTPNITISQASSTDDGYLSAADWNTFNSKQPAGNYITALSGEASGSGPGTASVTLNNASVTAKVLTGVNITGGSINASDSILTAFGKLQNQINGLIGSSVYQGTWNAATNTPALASGVGTRGYYYIVNVAGSTNLDGITDWNVGDWAIFDGTAWQQVDNTDSVTSVNGQTGAVSLTTDNIPEGATNLYFTSLRARQSLSLTTSGSSGASTYNNTTGVLNVPNYTLSGLGGVPTSRRLEINGVSYDLSADRSWSVGTVTSVATTGPITGGTITGSGTIGITQATTSTDGYLSSTDWNTFNNKQNAITLTTTGTSGAATLVGSTLNIPQYQSVITNPVTGTGTANYVARWTSSSVIGTGVLYDNGTNVGVNTTAPGKPLDVFGDVRFQSANSRLDFTTAYNGLNDLPAGILLSTWNTTNNNLSIIPSAQGTVGSKVVMGAYNGSVWRSMVEFTNTSGEPNLLLVKSAGNVGIGTSSPGASLHVAGAINSVPTGDGVLAGIESGYAIIHLNGTSATGSLIDFSVSGTDTKGRILYDNTSNYFTFGTNGSEKMRLTSSGSLGIGTTNPSYKLHVVGNVYGTTTAQFGSGYIDGTQSGWAIFGSNSLSNGIKIVLDGDVSRNDIVVATNGNIGIGTSSPSYKFDVAGTSRSDMHIFRSNQSAPTADAFIFRPDDNTVAIGTANAERMRINSFGQLLVGTTSGYSSNGKIVVQNGTIAAGSSNWNNSTTGNAIEVFGDTNSNGGTIWSLANGNQAWGNISISPLGGNVGIGTYSPSYKLDVAGTISNNSSQNIIYSSYDNVAALFQRVGTYGSVINLGRWGVSNSVTLDYPADGTFAITTNGGERMRITSAGNVGIGTTNPNEKLHVAGNIHAYAAGGIDAGLYASSSGGSTTIAIRSIGVTHFNGGNVGIGTTAPSAKLEVASAASGTTMVVGRAIGNSSIKASSDAGGYLALDSTGGGTILNHYSSDNIWLVTGGGNVGVGSTSPTQKLHVEGNLRVTGAYYDSNYSAGTSGQVLSSTGSGTDWVSLSEITGVDGTGTANYISKWLDANTITNSQLFDNGTNVGIGTASPSTRLDIGNTQGSGITLRYDASSAYRALITPYWNSSADTRIDFSINRIANVAPDIVMSVGYNNNVGIGTTAPANKLSINNGAFNVSSTTVSILNSNSTQKAHVGYDTFLIQQDDAPTLRLYETLENLSTTISSDAGLTSFATTGEMGLFVAGSSTAPGYSGLNGIQAIRIKSNGRVGIGTTAPGYVLEVNGGSDTFVASFINSSASQSFIRVGDSSDLNYSGLALYSDSGTGQIFKNGTGSNSWGGNASLNIYNSNGSIAFHPNDTANAMFIATSGNVGIGTTNPTSPGGFTKIVHINGGYASLVLTSTIPNKTWEIGVNASSLLTFYDGVADRMVINTSGNVGIGTTSPSQKLHVEGNVRVTGAYYDSNNQAGTSGQILSSTGSGTDWVDSPTATATSVSQLLPNATVTYNWVGSVVNDTWVDVFTRANTVLSTGTWLVKMYVNDFGQGGGHYTYTYSGTMTWYQDITNQTGVSAASEIELHRMGHAANDSILYLRTTEVSAVSGGNGKLQIKGNYSNTSNTTITFTFVKIM